MWLNCYEQTLPKCLTKAWLICSLTASTSNNQLDRVEQSLWKKCVKMCQSFVAAVLSTAQVLSESSPHFRLKILNRIHLPNQDASAKRQAFLHLETPSGVEVNCMHFLSPSGKIWEGHFLSRLWFYFLLDSLPVKCGSREVLSCCFFLFGYKAKWPLMWNVKTVLQYYLQPF